MVGLERTSEIIRPTTLYVLRFHLANGTATDCIVPDLYNGKTTLDAEEASHLAANLNWTEALESLEELASELREKAPKRRIGVAGFCMGGALSLAFASKMSKTKQPLNAALSFYGIPDMAVFDLSRIPSVTPVEAHFGAEDTLQGLSDPETAKNLAQLWQVAIKNDGGIHSHGLHSDEASVFTYPGKGHGFMVDNISVMEQGKKLGFKGMGDKEFQGKVWKHVFGFFRKHLKEI